MASDGTRSNMRETLKELVRQTREEIIASMSAAERLKGLTADGIVRALPPRR